MTNYEKIMEQISTEKGLVNFISDILDVKIDPSSDWCTHHCIYKDEDNCPESCEYMCTKNCVKDWLSLECE